MQDFGSRVQWQLVMHGWTNPAVAEAHEKNTLDWLNPDVATSSSSLSSTSVPDWLHTPVAVKRACPSGVSNPKLKQAHWLNPQVDSKFDSTPRSDAVPDQKSSGPEIDLTIGTALLVLGETEHVVKQKDLPKEIIQKVHSSLKNPCRHGKGKTGCTACQPPWNASDAVAFVALWHSMTKDHKAILLNTLYEQAGSHASSRVCVKFLGQRICISHLCEILQTAPRTFYKHAGGNADGRTTNGKTMTDSRISVDMFFYNLYHTAAEYLPEHEFQLNDVDSQIEAEQSGKKHAAAEQCFQTEGLLPLLGQDPEKQMLNSIAAFAGGNQLPVRYIQHQRVVDLWMLYLGWGSTNDKKASWSTFWRCWISTWFHCLRLRKPAQHSQCDVCFKASQFIHCSKASFREKQEVAKQWREHLRSQYQDRVVYWCLRYQSKQPQSDVLSIIIDGLDKSKLVYPSYGFINGAPKLLDKYHRPRCCIHLNLCHGYSADFWVTEEEGMVHGGSFVMETLVRSLAHIKQLRRQQGLELPKHLCLQCDNTVAQAKNAEVVLGMGMLVRRFAFDTTSLCFLRKGHTHEDVDFVFSILLSKVLRKTKMKTPQDLVNSISAMESFLAEKGYKIRSMLLTHCRDFKTWLASYGCTPYNCFMPRQGAECPHSFTFKCRMDLSRQEMEEVMKNEAQTQVQEKNDLDIFCVTKAFMASGDSFAPVLLIPHTRAHQLPATPSMSCEVVMADKRKADLLKFAEELEKLSADWGSEHSFFRAAAEIRILVHGRHREPSQDGFLESLVAAVDRRIPVPLFDSPLYSHLPNFWRMMVRFNR